MINEKLARPLLYTGALSFLLTFVFAFLANYPVAGIMVVFLFVVLGLYFRTSETLKTFTFSCWVFAFFFGALVFPNCLSRSV